jgi:hypothetical protein
VARLIREDEDGDVKDAAYHALLALAKASDKQETLWHVFEFGAKAGN